MNLDPHSTEVEFNPEKSIFQTHVPRKVRNGQFLLLILISFLLALMSAIFYAERPFDSKTQGKSENPTQARS